MLGRREEGGGRRETAGEFSTRQKSDLVTLRFADNLLRAVFLRLSPPASHLPA